MNPLRWSREHLGLPLATAVVAALCGAPFYIAANVLLGRQEYGVAALIYAVIASIFAAKISTGQAIQDHWAEVRRQHKSEAEKALP
jgi:hypothetical protein